MRTLIYVPIIHTSADLGSLAGDVTRRGIADLGEDFWVKHQSTVEGFWDVITDYFDTLDPAGLKIYQDGMIADGEMGMKIVEESLKSGSRNYAVVSKLLKRGAVLVKTEDLKLVKAEYDRLMELTRAESICRKLYAFLKYKIVKSRLLKKRDNYIIQRIEETLGQDETGILFIGALHDLISKLSKNFKIIEIKSIRKVRDYQLLLPSYHKDRQRFEQLSEYLVSQIDKMHLS
ncbi:MAG: hypothetical protein PHW04_03365 [Candidatus Wallbacteria bacterium]|nr:hypothetical protein [Candidatus Wallbacteria bacterium]